MILVQQRSDWAACDDGTEALGHAEVGVEIGALVLADLCVLHREGCVASSASALAAGDRVPWER